MDRIWAGGASDTGGPDLSELLTVEDNLADSHLISYEIDSLIAFHLELAEKKYIPAADSREILKGLVEVSGSEITFPDDVEDVHSLMQSRLSELSEAGRNLRIFLSRNDQSHTDIRSFHLDNLLETAYILSETALSVKKKLCAKEGYMAGYTHYRQAMPVSFATYFDHISASLHDLSNDAIDLYNKLSESCPMGYASGYGSSLKVDYDGIARRLGFRKAFRNPMHGASYRGTDEMEVSFLHSKILAFISRISQDLILFSSDEFGFLKLPAGFSTGSSLMPNKKNPDFLEMMQGYASEALSGVVMTISSVMNRASGYHREFQLSKDKVIMYTLRLKKILSALNYLLGHISVDSDASRKQVMNSTYATMEAFSMFSSGKRWKDSYREVGEKLASGSKIEEYVPVDYISVTGEILEEEHSRVNTLLKERRGIHERLVREATGFASAD